MTEVVVSDFAEWRRRARACLRRGDSPDRVHFLPAQGGQPVLFEEDSPSPTNSAAISKVPAEFLALAQTVGYFRGDERWNLLYSVLWRLTHGEHGLLSDHADPEVRPLRLMEKAVRRDIHKMRAFVRFRETADGVFVAWHRPDHLIARANAPFFAARFPAMKWAILTPDECVYWDTEQLRFGPGLPREAAPTDDRFESLWLTYYGAIFNPARVNLAAMTAEMPAKHWSTLPEARTIGELVRHAVNRTGDMIMQQPDSARSFLPEHVDSLKDLAQAARTCEGCELYKNATQTVFGEGPPQAKIMLIGEQPGDQEDRAGLPFVGPAGQLLDRALTAAGVDRSQVYVTNAVKHFFFEERGKRRIHKKPRGVHISACRPWLEAEIELVNPEVLVCLGATAAQALLGRAVSVMAERGKWLENRWGKKLLITVHPSYLLRLPDSASADEEFDRYVNDLKLIPESGLLLNEANESRRAKRQASGS